MFSNYTFYLYPSKKYQKLKVFMCNLVLQQMYQQQFIYNRFNNKKIKKSQCFCCAKYKLSFYYEIKKIQKIYFKNKPEKY